MNDQHRECGFCQCSECAAKRAYADFLSGIMAIEVGDDPLHIFDDMGDASQSNPQIGKISQPNRKHTGDRRNGGK